MGGGTARFLGPGPSTPGGAGTAIAADAAAAAAAAAARPKGNRQARRGSIGSGLPRSVIDPSLGRRASRHRRRPIVEMTRSHPSLRKPSSLEWHRTLPHMCLICYFLCPPPSVGPSLFRNGRVDEEGGVDGRRADGRGAESVECRLQKCDWRPPSFVAHHLVDRRQGDGKGRRRQTGTDPRLPQPGD